MRIVMAECSAVYTGRGDSTLERGLRAVLIKSDGSVSIHNDNSNKPLNYMKTASQTLERNEFGEEVWTFDARHESLRITIHKLISEFEQQLLDKDSEPGLVRDGTEAHLQAWLFDHPETFGKSFVSVAREFETGAGPVDILALDERMRPVAIEIKRVATLGAADQVRRYAEAMKSLDPMDFVHPESGNEVTIDFNQSYGVIAALDLRPKLLAMAAKRGIQTMEIPHYWRDQS